MVTWLKRAQSTLLDALLIYVAFKWIPPLALALVLYSLSSAVGTFALLAASLALMDLAIKKMADTRFTLTR
jgi:hypothetical protein